MSTLEEYANKALEKEMNTGAELDDPYWKLFECKDAVNEAIVESYKMGFKRGVVVWLEESNASKMITQISKLEKDLYQQRFNNEHNLSIDQTVSDEIKRLKGLIEIATSALRDIIGADTRPIPCPDNKPGCCVLHYGVGDAGKIAQEAINKIGDK